MIRVELVEVLNDLMDYFLIGDIHLLQKFKQDNAPGDDMAAEFISADRAVQNGIENGLYNVEILGGEVLRGEDYEPALEFLFKKTERIHVTSEVDISYRFSIDSNTY